MKKPLPILNFALLSIVLGLFSASAQDFPGLGLKLNLEEAPEVVATILTERDAVVPGEPFAIGVKLEIKEKWHTYWENSGGVEQPTKIELALPEGFQAGPLLFPYPHYFTTEWGTGSYGYNGEVIHPVILQVPADLEVGSTIAISGTVRWQACFDLCIPGEKAFTLSLPVVAAVEGEANAELTSAIAAVPQALEGGTLTFSESGEDIVATVQFPEGKAPASIEGLRLFPIDQGVIDSTSAQELNLEGDALTIRSKKHADFESIPPSVSAVLANSDGSVALALQSGAASGGSASPPVIRDSATTHEGPFGGGFLGILLAGFLGGLILNVMPCVFPVISLKIMSFVTHGGDDRKKIALHGIVFSLGILVFFWVLAAILVAIRAGGSEVNWAFQFGSPVFVMAMTAVMVLLALNLFGVFELGTSLTGVGGKLTTSTGYGGSFWSGALATLLATPCSGPFLGSAIFAALTWSAPQMILFFTVMGLGMSLPYLLISAFPKLLSKMPRPGAWMETFKQAMGFPMLAAAIWLLWVLAAIVGDAGWVRFLFALLLMSIAAWAWGRFCGPAASNAKKWSGRVIALVGVIGALVLSGQARDYRPEVTRSEPVAEVIAGHQAEGKAVFVDFTARWCGICQANKPAIHSEAVEAALEANNAVLVIADYTNYDPAIKIILDQYQQSSVPFYPIFPADPDADPILLPSTLTVGTIIDGLEALP